MPKKAKRLYKAFFFSIENKKTKEKRYGKWYEWTTDKINNVSKVLESFKDVEEEGIKDYIFKIEKVLEMPKSTLERQGNKLFCEFLEQNI